MMFLEKITRVAMGASQPTTLNGRMAVLAPGGRHPSNIYLRNNNSKPGVTQISNRS